MKRAEKIHHRETKTKHRAGEALTDTHKRLYAKPREHDNATTTPKNEAFFGDPGNVAKDRHDMHDRDHPKQRSVIWGSR